MLRAQGREKAVRRKKRGADGDAAEHQGAGPKKRRVGNSSHTASSPTEPNTAVAVVSKVPKKPSLVASVSVLARGESADGQSADVAAGPESACGGTISRSHFYVGPHADLEEVAADARNYASDIAIFLCASIAQVGDLAQKMRAPPIGEELFKTRGRGAEARVQGKNNKGKGGGGERKRLHLIADSGKQRGGVVEMFAVD